jgi:two-component system cell cycle response regulator CtrA
MMRVLLIEDDSAMAALTELVLRENKFIVDTTELGEDGLEIGKLYDYDIIILDLTLPDIDGYEVLRRLRAAQVCTPVLVVSGRAGIDSKIKALGVGADDFMTKPFNSGELIARIQAVVRRSEGHPQSTIHMGKLTINISTRTVSVGDQKLHLTSKEYGILELLSLRKGVTLNKDVFLNHLYGGLDEPEPKIIDVFVCKLRKKLIAATGGDHYIETVWGRGYVMREQIPAGEQLKAVRIRSADGPPAHRAA